jgi:hypothetical protein
MRPASPPIDRGAALLGLGVIVLANLRYLAGLASVLDPVLEMEPYYIDMAKRRLVEVLAQNPTWGTLYAAWLRPFRLLLDDPLRVYAANVHVLSFALSVAAYVYALLATRRAAIATGAALFFLVSDFNVPLSSKVCAFALVVVLAGLALSELAGRRERRMAIAAGGVLLASYARPELYPSGLCVWLAALWLARGHWRERGTLGWALGGTAAILAAAWAIGTPIWSPRHHDARLIDAVREHFAWNWTRWTGEPGYYLTIWQREFGAADGVVGAIRANPAAVARHVAANVAGSVRVLFGATFAHYPLLAPSTSPVSVTLEMLVVAVASLWCVVTVLIRRDLRAVALRRHGDAGIVFCALAIFPLGGAAVVYPNIHYLIVPAACLLFATVFAIGVRLPSPSVTSPWRRVVLAVACLAAVPTPFVLPSEYFAGRRAPLAKLATTRDVTDAIQRIRALDLPRPTHVLTFNDGLGELLGTGFAEIKVWQRGAKSLKALIADEHVDVIVTLDPGRHSFRVDDPYWETIQLEPATTGFAPVPTPQGARARIWVRENAGAPPAP